MKDLYSNVKTSVLFNPAANATSDTPIVSSIIDTKDYEQLLMVLSFGSLSDANATFVVLVEDGNDSGLTDNAAVADSGLNGTEVLAAPLFSSDNSVKKIGYIGNKRYVRMTITPSGNTGDIYLSGVAIQGCPRVKPVA